MKEVLEELSEKRFPEIIDEYLSLASFDLRRLLASRDLSPESLEVIKALGQWLAQDADWCLNNRGKAPDTDVRNRVGRPKEIERAHIIETLVTLIKQSPPVSDGEIARRFWATPFLRGDIKNLQSFADKLKQHSDKVSEYLWNRLSPEVQELSCLRNEGSVFPECLMKRRSTWLTARAIAAQPFAYGPTARIPKRSGSSIDRRIQPPIRTPFAEPLDSLTRRRDEFPVTLRAGGMKDCYRRQERERAVRGGSADLDRRLRATMA
jgi:hypothetical protein